MTLNPKYPHPIGGIAYKSDESTVLPNITIVLTNHTNDETLTTTTDGSGKFLFDCANFTSYSDGDILTLSEVNQVMEGQAICDYIGRKVVKCLKTDWKTELINELYTPVQMGNNPLPFDEPLNIFRRQIDFKFTGVDLGD